MDQVNRHSSKERRHQLQRYSTGGAKRWQIILFWVSLGVWIMDFEFAFRLWHVVFDVENEFQTLTYRTQYISGRLMVSMESSDVGLTLQGRCKGMV